MLIKRTVKIYITNLDPFEISDILFIHMTQVNLSSVFIKGSSECSVTTCLSINHKVQDRQLQSGLLLAYFLLSTRPLLKVASFHLLFIMAPILHALFIKLDVRTWSQPLFNVCLEFNLSFSSFISLKCIRKQSK